MRSWGKQLIRLQFKSRLNYVEIISENAANQSTLKKKKKKNWLGTSPPRQLLILWTPTWESLKKATVREWKYAPQIHTNTHSAQIETMMWHLPSSVINILTLVHQTCCLIMSFGRHLTERIWHFCHSPCQGERSAGKSKRLRPMYIHDYIEQSWRVEIATPNERFSKALAKQKLCWRWSDDEAIVEPKVPLKILDL